MCLFGAALGWLAPLAYGAPIREADSSAITETLSYWETDGSVFAIVRNENTVYSGSRVPPWTRPVVQLA